MISLILPLAKINMCQTVRQQYPTTWSNWLKLGSQPLFPLVCQTWWLVPTIQGVFQLSPEQCFALPGAKRGWMAWQLLNLNDQPNLPQRSQRDQIWGGQDPPPAPGAPTWKLILQPVPFQETFSSGSLLFPGWEEQECLTQPKDTHQFCSSSY